MAQANKSGKIHFFVYLFMKCIDINKATLDASIFSLKGIVVTIFPYNTYTHGWSMDISTRKQGLSVKHFCILLKDHLLNEQMNSFNHSSLNIWLGHRDRKQSNLFYFIRFHPEQLYPCRVNVQVLFFITIKFQVERKDLGIE